MHHSERKNTTHAINNSDEPLLCQNPAVYRCSEGKQRLWTAVTCVLQAKALPADSSCQSRFYFHATLMLKSVNEQSVNLHPLFGSSQQFFLPFCLSPLHNDLLSAFFFSLSLLAVLHLSSLLDFPAADGRGRMTIFRDTSVVRSPWVVKLCISGHSTSHFHLLRKNSEMREMESCQRALN